MALDQVPVIDIENFQSGRAEAIAREVDEAFRNIGFMTIVGHGVSQQVIESVDRVSRQFFHLPVNEKIESKSAVGKGNRGYVAEGVEAADVKPDLKESFAIGRMSPPKSDMAGQPKFEPNIWPSRPADFRSAFEEYYKAMEHLSFRLIAIYERALKLAPGYLATLFSEHASILRVHHYPAQKVAPLPGQIRIGAHTDYGAFTILKVKKVPGARGFQVLTKQKEWVDIEPHEDSFLINIGDLMMTWTNDKWQSNLHRVINPKEESENVERFSIPYFVQPNYDALIECISSCVGPGERPKYEPVTAGAYRAKKFEQLYERARARCRAATENGRFPKMKLSKGRVMLMKRFARQRVVLTLLTVALVTWGASAVANEWPTRAVRIIVPFPAGGATDRMARLIAEELSKTFKQQFYIENRVGAGGAVGGLQAAKADPDGYTLLMGNYSTNMTTPIQNPTVGYHAIDDFTNIAMVGGEATALVLNSSLNVKTFPDWVDWVKKQRDPVNVGGAGPGTISELIVEQLKRSPSLKLNLNMVGYPTGNMMTNLLGNHIPAAVATLSAVVPHLQGTTLVPVALAANERNPAAQNVPTFAELGHPQIGAILWYYVAGPKKMPRDIVDRLNVEIRKLIKAPALAKQLEISSYITMDADAAALTDFLARDFAKWTAMYENAGFKTK